MRNTVALSWAALTLTALIAVGCNGNSTSVATSGATPTPQPTPSTPCTAPPGESIQMVFPIPNQSNAPNLQGVVFAVAPNPLPSNWYIYAGPKSQFGSTAFTNSVAFLATPVPIPGSTAGSTPTPLPTPSATPLAANPIFESASIGTFANNSFFDIMLANTNCFPGIEGGSFTTNATDLPSPTPTST